MKRKVVKGEKHFTSSVWILSKTSPKKILLLYHKKLDKWLQPGGHIELFENPIETAIREIHEETGLNISALKKNIRIIDEIGTFLPVPDFLMEQTIPEKNGQPQHFHVDLQYVFEMEEEELVHNPGEAHDIGWFTKEQAAALFIDENTKVVLQKIL